jgi:hypothetical protein
MIPTSTLKKMELLYSEISLVKDLSPLLGREE